MWFLQKALLVLVSMLSFVVFNGALSCIFQSGIPDSGGDFTDSSVL